MDRRDYLIHCVTISLKRRAMWILAGALAGLALGFVANFSLVLILLLGLLAGVVIATWIAVSSWSRHSGDSEARHRETAPSLSARKPNL